MKCCSLQWRPLGTLICVSGLVSLSGAVQAGGFALIEHGASGMGNAYAGAGAVSHDTSTIWFNPAGMSELDGRQAAVALHILSASTDWSDRGTSLGQALGGGPASGPDDASPGTVSTLPNIYYSSTINEQWSYGIGIGVPYGSSTEYDDDWKGRYTTIKSGISVIDINPSVSYRLNDTVRFGAGISLQMLQADLTSAVDSGAVCFSVYAADPGRCVENGLTPGVQANDSLGEITGDSTAMSFNLGMLFLPRPGVKLGIAYRHSSDHELDGKGDFTTNPALQGLFDNDGNPVTSTFFQDPDAKAEVSLPATLSFSGAWDVNDRIQLLGDLTWTGWSSFKELRVNYQNSAVPRETLSIQDWDDVVRLSVGTNFQQSEKLILRAGLAWDQEPIPGPDRRTARIPGNDRTWLSFGAGYQVNRNISLDVGYSHLFLEKTAIDNANTETAGGSAVRGFYESGVDIISAQFTWQFN